MPQDRLPSATVRFPFLHLLRAANLAFRPKKLLLGVFGLLLLASGEWLIARLPFAPASGQQEFVCPFDFHRAKNGPLAAIARLSTEWLIDPVTKLSGGTTSYSELAIAWTRLLWGLSVWSITGMSLCRITAVEFATGSTTQLRSTLRFALRQFQACLLAPLLPVSVAVLLGLANHAISEVCGLLPGSSTILSVMSGFILLNSFLIAVLMLIALCGWPLMTAAISTEDSDGFDGLSRSFNYLFDRPWYAASLATLSFIIGLIGWAFLSVLLSLTVHIAQATTGLSPVQSLFDGLPESLTSLWMNPPRTGATQSAKTSGSFWINVVLLFQNAYLPVFFWTAATISYFLLRLSSDATSLSEVNRVREPERTLDGAAKS